MTKNESEKTKLDEVEAVAPPAIIKTAILTVTVLPFLFIAGLFLDYIPLFIYHLVDIDSILLMWLVVALNVIAFTTALSYRLSKYAMLSGITTCLFTALALLLNALKHMDVR